MRVVVHLLAIALIGAWATLACLAEDALGIGGDSTPSANPGDSKAVTGEGADKGNAAGGGVKPSVPGGKDSDAIDTRITVQPPRVGKRDELSAGNIRPIAPHIFRPRRSAHESRGRVSRDAIGLPVARSGGMEQGSAEHPLGNNPAGAPTGFGSNSSGGVARPGGTLGYQPSKANPNVRSSPLNRGTINGTNVARPGVGPSSVGGPAKPSTGISGTTIRPKHSAP